MTTVLAAIDDSSAAVPVLAFAEVMAGLLDAAVDAVHVHEAGKQTAVAVAEQRGCPVRVLHGDPVSALVDACRSPEVALVVVGTRGRPGGPRPAGHVAISVLEQVTTPALVVPPEAVLPAAAAPIQRALFAFEGASEASAASVDIRRRLQAADVALLGVHVFDATTVPAFWDEPGHADESWRRQFVSQWCGKGEIALHLRRGPAPETVVDLARAEHVDLIVLEWSRRLDPDRAHVVRAALNRTSLPVLLVPVD